MKKEISQKDKIKDAQNAGPIRRFFSILGPGLITGAADDDPSGIATYSITGAQSGTSLLWTAWVTWPLMAGVQMMCARIGMVSEKGLAAALTEKFPKVILLVLCFFLLAANTINIAADLLGMADAANLLTGLPSSIFVVVFGVGIGFAIIRCRYHQIVNALKWMAIALLGYIVVPFLLHSDWPHVLKDAVTFTLPHDSTGWETLVGLLGTTISPYLFYWQASQEVEEYRAHKHMSIMPLPPRKRLADRAIDVGTGTFLSNIVMFFIILTTALTLNAHGITNIESSKQAAEALRPLAGHFASLLYTVGLVITGLLAIPTLAGSSAYAFAETLRWKHGLDTKLDKSQLFYGVIIFSVLCGILLDFAKINPMQALLWSAVINGILAPFLLFAVLMVGRDKKIMKGQPSSLLNQAVVLVTALLMTAAAVALFVV